ncbi:bestrophin-like domain [Longispora urticae]
MSAVDVGVVVGSVLAAVLMLAAMTRWFPERWRDGGLAAVDQFAGVNKTLFSFILALSLVSASASLAQAGTQVNNEAASLTNFYWATRPLAPEPRERLRTLTREYTAAVVDEEWPEMAEGRTSHRAQELYDEMRRALQDAEKSGSGRQDEFTRDALVSLRAVGDARRARTLSISQQIPSYLWIGLIVSAILVVAAAASQVPKLSAPGVVGIGLLALLLSSVLTVLSALNHPFGGGIQVEPDSLRYALERFAVI